jgi:DNA-binding transcriptional LysR family regulator
METNERDVYDHGGRTVIRNLDIAALRSFATVAETGGVTRAAARLNLTQSAVSMQIKRLEQMLDLTLFDRTPRSMSVTAEGEQLLSYARRMLALNDEAWARMTAEEWEGELTLGVPHDIVYPHIPAALRDLARIAPRLKIALVASYTRALKPAFERGEMEVILTTEDAPGPGGETLTERPLVWIGARDGAAWRKRPLPLAFEPSCIFRPLATAALDAAGVSWTMAVESASARGIEAAVSADLAVFAGVDTAVPPQLEAARHGDALPPLPRIKINLYAGDGPKAAMIGRVADAIRTAFAADGARKAA